MVKREADYLKELIAFPSISSDKKTSGKCAAYCAQFFQKYGLHTEIIESDGYPSVFATSRKTKKPKVLLQAHMDVVPAQPELFKMKRADGRLMGRGAFDMKFACASYMKLVEELSADISKYDFGIMLTFDEEIGGHDGVEKLLDQGYGAELCILPDSGKDWNLEASAHGAWFLKLKKEGRNAHASMPELGINAAQVLVDTINEIHKFCGKYNKADLILSLTKINAGAAINQIPDYAEATIDIRFKNAKIQEKIGLEIEKICEKHKVDFETVVLAECMNVDSTMPQIKAFLKIAEEVINRKIDTCHSLGTTDARYFCAKGIPCVVIQPNGGGRHADNEWVDETGVKNFTDILLRFVAEYT